MGTMTEHSLDDILANEAQRPVLEQIANLMGEMVLAQTDLIARLEPPPKSESRLAWEAVHPSWDEQLADGFDLVNRCARETLLGEPGQATPEMQGAGCRR